jgi:hypothetical protein
VGYVFTPDCTRSGHLNDIQEKILLNYIEKVKEQGADGWSYYNNCSDFASNAWNKATNEKLDPSNEWVSTPKGLKKDIWWKNGLRNHKKIKTKRWIRFFEVDYAECFYRVIDALYY